MGRDPRAASPTFDDRDHDLAWYQQHHPDWILHTCRKSAGPTEPQPGEPAYLFGDQTLVPLDITNPSVVAWQLEHFGVHAQRARYDALSIDNVYLKNLYGACGVFRGDRFVQKYDASNPDDPRWCRDVAGWLSAIRQVLSSFDPPIRVVANVAPLPRVLTECFRTVVDNVDGVLDEGAFMAPTLDRRLDEADWLARIRLMLDTQRRGRAWFSLAEFRTDPDPSNHCGLVVSRDDVEWSIASYLMGKEQAAALAITGYLQYGCTLWHREFDTPVGTPCGPMRRVGSAFVRYHTGGISIVNPSTRAQRFQTTTETRDTRGQPVSASFELSPGMGRVLLHDLGRCPSAGRPLLVPDAGPMQ